MKKIFKIIPFAMLLVSTFAFAGSQTIKSESKTLSWDKQKDHIRPQQEQFEQDKLVIDQFVQEILQQYRISIKEPHVALLPNDTASVTVEVGLDINHICKNLINKQNAVLDVPSFGKLNELGVYLTYDLGEVHDLILFHSSETNRSRLANGYLCKKSQSVNIIVTIGKDIRFTETTKPFGCSFHTQDSHSFRFINVPINYLKDNPEIQAIIELKKNDNVSSTSKYEWRYEIEHIPSK